LGGFFNGEYEMTTAQLEWSLMLSCPKCEEDIDLASGDYDADNCISEAIFSNRWDDLRGLEIECQECGHEFKLESVEY
jgi:Zn finger protein HypA/HybF involved in hydrogenase expression